MNRIKIAIYKKGKLLSPQLGNTNEIVSNLKKMID